MLNPPRPELPLLSFPPFLVDDISSCEVTLAPRVPSIWGEIINSNRTDSLRKQTIQWQSCAKQAKCCCHLQQRRKSTNLLSRAVSPEQRVAILGLGLHLLNGLVRLHLRARGSIDNQEEQPLRAWRMSPPDKLSVPLNYFFFHQDQHEH